MTKLRILIKLHLKSLFGLNRLRYSREPRARLKRALTLVGLPLLAAIVMAYSGGYSVFLAEAFRPTGDIDAVPLMMFSLCSLVTLISAIIRGCEQLITFRDYDVQMSLPVSPGLIAVSRLVIAYIEELVISLLVLLPAFGVYVFYARPAAGAYAALAFALFLSPMLPIIFGTLVSTLVHRFSARFRGAKYLRLVLLLGFLAAYFAFCFSLGNDNGEKLAGMTLDLSGTIKRVYPPAGLFARALNGSAAAFIAFVALSLGAFALLSLFYAHFLRRLRSKVAEMRARGQFRMKRLSAASPLKALYKRELRHYVSSTPLFMNTIFGSIMGVVVGVALLIVDKDTLAGFLIPLGINESASLIALIPFLILFFAGSSVVTSSSISLEGESHWLIKCIPVPPVTVFRAKILFGLTVLMPLYTVAPALTALALKPDAISALILFLIPAAACVCLSEIGLIINLRLHRFDWKNEQQVVKQSASVSLAMLVGVVFSLPFMALIVVFPQTASLISALAAAFFLVLALILASLLRARAEKAMRAL